MKYAPSVIFSCILASTAAQASENWKQLSHGVYQTTEADGTVTTMSYGADGADYDRLKLQRAADELRSRVNSADASADDAKILADTLQALAGIPKNASGHITPKTSTSGTVCGYPYAFDSHLVVGKVGATAVARAAVLPQNFAPLPPTVLSSATYATASINNGTTSTGTNSLPANSQGHILVAQAAFTQDTMGYPLSCTASTFSYVQATSSSCTGSAGYVSQSKSYPSCTSTP